MRKNRKNTRIKKMIDNHLTGLSENYAEIKDIIDILIKNGEQSSGPPIVTTEDKNSILKIQHMLSKTDSTLKKIG